MGMAAGIYLMGLCDNLRVALCAVIGLCGVAVFPIFIAFASDDMRSANFKKWGAALLTTAAIGAALLVVTPSSKTIAAMYLAPAIIQNEKVQGLTGASLDAAIALMRKWTEDSGGQSKGGTD